MALQQLDPTSARSSRETILVYGPAGAGKTRFATALTPRFGKIAYIALDEGSEGLKSVLPKYRDRIAVFRPEGKNPLVDLSEIVSVDWKSKGFDTVLLDTLTNAAWKILQTVTNNGMFQANHVSVGTPGTPSFVALPDQGDYHATHGILRAHIQQLVGQQTCHIIVVCHEELLKDKAGTVLVGGPATVGQAIVSWLPARFDTVIRLDRKFVTAIDPTTKAPVQKPKHLAWMSQHGYWIARRNEDSEKGNPLPSLELDIDPINFWKRYDETAPNKQEETK